VFQDDLDISWNYLRYCCETAPPPRFPPFESSGGNAPVCRTHVVRRTWLLTMQSCKWTFTKRCSLPFLYTTKQMLYVTITVTKIALRWQQYPFSPVLRFTKYKTMRWLTAISSYCLAALPPRYLRSTVACSKTPLILFRVKVQTKNSLSKTFLLSNFS